MPLSFSACAVTHDLRGKPMGQPVLQRMLDNVADLINEAILRPKPTKMAQWFGKNFTVGDKTKAQEAVIAQTVRLGEWLASHQPLQFITKDAGGTLAFADQSNDRPEIFLGHGFPQSRWTWGERVCTLIHEFTHKAIATKDVAIGSSMTMEGPQPIWSYGMKCLTLADDAKLYPQALENAENWGFYLCSYRVEAGVAVVNDPNWKYLERKDWLAGRTSYLEDVQGHKDDPFMFTVSAPDVAARFARVPVGSSSAAAAPLMTPGPERFPCECGQVFPAAFLHKNHLAVCRASAVRGQFHIPTALGVNGKPRSQAEHLQLAARRARQLDNEDD